MANTKKKKPVKAKKKVAKAKVVANKKKKAPAAKKKKKKKAVTKTKAKKKPVAAKKKKKTTAAKPKKKVAAKKKAKKPVKAEKKAPVRKKNAIVVPHTLKSSHPDMLHYNDGKSHFVLCKWSIGEMGAVIPLKGNEHLLEKYKDLGAKKAYVRGTQPTCPVCKEKLKELKRREKVSKCRRRK